MVLLLFAAGCAHDEQAATGSADVESQSLTAAGSEATPTPGISAHERLDLAVTLLQKGDAAHAEVELKSYLSQVPDSKSAKLLLSEIETPISNLYPKENFAVTLGKNDTLSGLAANYLGDPLAFYGLARYNNIAAPGKIVAGQQIRIPKTSAAIAAQADRDPASKVASATSLPLRLTSSADETAPATEPPRAAAPDPWNDFKLAVAAGRFVDAAKAADNLQAGSGQAPALAETWLRAAALEQSVDPASAAAHAAKAGNLYLKALKNPDKARAAFQLALSAVPSDAAAQSGLRQANARIAGEYYRRGLVAFQHQDLDGAIAAWNKVLAVDPENRDAQLNRAQALQLKANLQKLRG